MIPVAGNELRTLPVFRLWAKFAWSWWTFWTCGRQNRYSVRCFHLGFCLIVVDVHWFEKSTHANRRCKLYAGPSAEERGACSSPLCLHRQGYKINQLFLTVKLNCYYFSSTTQKPTNRRVHWGHSLRSH